MKYCKCCRKSKLESEFYVSNGYLRGECKDCMNKNAYAYQRRSKSYKDRAIERSEYMKRYYAEHKEAFKKYRETFKEKHPEYHLKWRQDRKD